MNMMLRRTAVIVLGTLMTMVAIIFMSSGALAYQLLGYTWPDGVNPLTWRDFFEHTELWTAFDAAMDDWDNTSTPVSFSYDEWYFQVAGIEYNEDDGNYGYMDPYLFGNDLIAADIYLNWYNLGDNSANERRGTAGHEWGHAFGLDHESGTVLMNPSRNRSQIYVPQSDDINGVNAMY